MAYPVNLNAPMDATQFTCSICPQINVWRGDITSKRIFIRKGSLVVVEID